ncbi:hypothetical protein C0991_000592 [Blastosporella zonata]|nr:hypothetical protein C0991_000592 [Blastosporella zonata]
MSTYETGLLSTSGSVEHVDEKKHNFDLAPEQYVAACKDISGKPTFPAQCRIPDTARWKDRVPKVKEGSYVSVGGFLSGIIRNDKNGIKQFVIEVEKITFLGRAPITPRAIEGSLETPVKQGKGLKFDYNSPSPLSSKRRRVEPGSSSSSIIEPELLQ